VGVAFTFFSFFRVIYVIIHFAYESLLPFGRDPGREREAFPPKSIVEPS